MNCTAGCVGRVIPFATIKRKIKHHLQAGPKVIDPKLRKDMVKVKKKEKDMLPNRYTM